MKRAFTFMMALVLVFSLGITAFADAPTNGSITISNATIGVNYKLYKIFDATYKAGSGDLDKDGTQDVVSYTLDKNSPVYNYMFGNLTPDNSGDDRTSNDYFTYDPASGVVTLKEGVTDTTAVMQYLTDMVRGMYDTDTAPAVSDGCFVANQIAGDQEITFSNLAYGYYLIDTEKATDTTEDKAKIAVTVTTNTPNVTVIEKNQLPGQLEKTIVPPTNANVVVGDTVHWEVTFKATNYDGSKKVLRYTIKDTLTPTNWADFDLTSVTVAVSSETNPLTVLDDYTLTPTNDANGNLIGFVIDIFWAETDANNNFTDFKYDPTETVTITYSATVNSNAILDNPTALKNNAELDWDTDINNNIPEGDGGEDDTEIKIHNLGFSKVDGSNQTGTVNGNPVYAPLAGVKFALYKADGTTPVNVTGGTDGVYTLADATATNPTNELVTPTDGNVVVKGLPAGTYVLKETETLPGYNKLGTPVTIVIGDTQTVTDPDTQETTTTAITSTITVNGTTYTVSHLAQEIQNFQGVELPSTGGKGTLMLITFGTMVALAFGVLMITQKKMSIYND